MKFVNHHQGCCGYVPTHADGSEWGHVLTLGAGTVVHADTARECVEELITGYDRCPDDAARLIARTRHAVATADGAQRGYIDRAAAKGDLDVVEEAGLVDILRASKAEPLLLATPDAPGEQAEWLGAVPFVAVTTAYAPHSGTPPLRGRIVWLDPSSDEAYLTSLHTAGVHDYWRAATA